MKNIIHAVRGVLIENNKILCIKNKIDRVGYYDLPGGKIEESETSYKTCIREFIEETGITVTKAIKKGIIVLNTKDSIINLEMFDIKEYKGKIIEDLEENYCMWMDINEYLSQEKLFANSIILDNFFYKVFKSDREFEIDIEIDELEEIQRLNFKYR